MRHFAPHSFFVSRKGSVFHAQLLFRFAQNGRRTSSPAVFIFELRFSSLLPTVAAAAPFLRQTSITSLRDFSS
jgi:hypothetical protein